MIVPDVISNTEKSNDDSSPIQRFFSNSTIFVTGGTGFLGILLLEKLLFSCPGICKIYMLIRSKKGKSVQIRLDELFEDVVFSRLKQKYPDFRKKIVPVEGDCELPELGLNAEDRTILKTEVDVVFHLAATVRFDEALRKAAFINVRGVRDIVKLAQEMPKLKSFVHVSTAYSNCLHRHIKEEVYPPVLDYQKLLHVTEGLPDEILSTITPILVDKFPNTYTYTKQIAEDVVKQEGKGLPIGIHRPSIVISTHLEPVRGWVNNLYGPAGIMAGGGAGLIRAVYLNPVIKANMIPADLTINSIIVSAWDIAENHSKTAEECNEIPVYNFEESQSHKLTFSDFTERCVRYGYKYYSVKCIWYMNYFPCDNQLSYDLHNFIIHKVPAFLVDIVRFCLGKPPMLLKVYKKVDKMVEVLNYFRLQEWTFEAKRLSKLESKMNEEDRKTFFFNINELDWEEYLDYYVQGVRAYLIKDPLDTIPEGQKVYRRAYWMHQGLKAVTISIFLWILWCFLSLIFKSLV